jgi:hypothetical protein
VIESSDKKSPYQTPLIFRGREHLFICPYNGFPKLLESSGVTHGHGPITESASFLPGFKHASEV